MHWAPFTTAIICLGVLTSAVTHKIYPKTTDPLSVSAVTHTIYPKTTDPLEVRSIQQLLEKVVGDPQAVLTITSERRQTSGGVLFWSVPLDAAQVASLEESLDSEVSLTLEIFCYV